MSQLAWKRLKKPRISLAHGTNLQLVFLSRVNEETIDA